MEKLYQVHLKTVLSNTHRIMEEEGVDRLFIESGFPDYYFLDDQPTPFRPNPHFLYFCPDLGQGHILLIEKGQTRPKLFFFIPDDFWHEVSTLKGEFWESSFDIEVVNNYEKTWKHLKTLTSGSMTIAPSTKTAESMGSAVASEGLVNKLHWIRTNKSLYEIECIQKANEIAAKGHHAAKDAFYRGESESNILNAYLQGSNQRENDMPYGAIVGFDTSSAVLHYQFPKSKPNGKTFLIDAGARFNGYCSDITRSYFTDSVDDRFKTLHNMTEIGQAEQVAMVKPGVNYVEIHKMACEQATKALIETNVITCPFDEAYSKKLFNFFFPHGVGHPLGLQVHDVAGKQTSALGGSTDQPSDFPYLRTLRTIQENDVLTIEPGIYFIPMLLQKLKSDPSLKSLIDWKVVEDLTVYGGIRIEDNVAAMKGGPRNLTRPLV